MFRGDVKIGIPKIGKMRQSGGLPGSGGYLLNFAAMDLKCNSSAWLYFSSQQVRASWIYQKNGTVGGDK